MAAARADLPRARRSLRLALCALALAHLATGCAPPPAAVGESAYDLRFRGVSALYGKRALERFRASHVAVIGVGGVGSWAAEAIARTGFGAITLVDLDDVCISNTNRQLHSLDSTIGQLKVEVLAQRIAQINPECHVRALGQWLTAEDAPRFVRASEPAYDVVVDAIDGVVDKCALIRACVESGTPVVTTGGAGGKRDPTKVRATDLALVSHDPLLQKVRRALRTRHGWPEEQRGCKPAAGAWGVMAVSSVEPAVRGTRSGSAAASCDVFGTVTHLTGTFGFVAAAVAADILAAEARGGGGASGGHYGQLRERIAASPLRTAAGPDDE
jgi:tRNA A37 threonylcarbamoyladenosine dehydratase